MSENLKVYSNIDLKENSLLNVSKIVGSEFNNKPLEITTAEVPASGEGTNGKKVGNIYIQAGKNLSSPEESGDLYLCGSRVNIKNEEGSYIEDLDSSYDSNDFNFSCVKLGADGQVSLKSSNLIQSFACSNWLGSDDHTFVAFLGREDLLASSIHLATSKKVSYACNDNEEAAFPQSVDSTSTHLGFFVDSPTVFTQARYLKEVLGDLEKEEEKIGYFRTPFYTRTIKQDTSSKPDNENEDTSTTSIFTENAGPRKSEGGERENYSYQVDVKKIKKYKKDSSSDSDDSWVTSDEDYDYVSTIEVDNLKLYSSFVYEKDKTTVELQPEYVNIFSPELTVNSERKSNICNIYGKDYTLKDSGDGEGSFLSISNIKVGKGVSFEGEYPTIEIVEGPLNVSSPQGYSLCYGGDEGLDKEFISVTDHSSELHMDTLDALRVLNSREESLLKGFNVLKGFTLVSPSSEEALADLEKNKIKENKYLIYKKLAGIDSETGLLKTSEVSSNKFEELEEDQKSEYNSSECLRVSSDIIIGKVKSGSDGISTSTKYPEIIEPTLNISAIAENVYTNISAQLNEGTQLDEKHNTVGIFPSEMFKLKVGKGYADIYPSIISYIENEKTITWLFVDSIRSDVIRTSEINIDAPETLATDDGSTDDNYSLSIFYDTNSGSIVFAQGTTFSSY